MKASEQLLNETCREEIEAIVARHMHALFERVPMLCGFWVRPDMEVTALEVFPWAGYIANPAFYDEVMQSLVDLAEEHPEAVALMRGRTFARAVH